MMPTHQGRHCGACNKVVIDFSNMKDEDIIQYLLKNTNSCGRFYKAQLAQPMVMHLPRRKSNWPAIAAMLIAGLVSIAPGYSETIHGNLDPREHHSVFKPEKEPMKTEPGTTSGYEFTLRLFKINSDQRVYNGWIKIEGLGTYMSDTKGNILIKANSQELPEVIQLTITAPGYEHKQVTIYRKDLKGSANADIYLNEMEMVAGIVAIDGK